MIMFGISAPARCRCFSYPQPVMPGSPKTPTFSKILLSFLFLLSCRLFWCFSVSFSLMSLLFISTASYAGKPQDTYLFENPPDKPFKDVMTEDKANKPKVMDKQKDLIDQRYDLGDKPSSVKMSGGRKAVQKGVRVKLPKGMSWEKLAKMSPDEIRDQGLFPAGFLPLPHVKHEVGGQVFPKNQIKEIRDLEHRSLERFDVEFDIPDQFTPEFPPPIFLSTRPDLGDVSQGKLQ